ncbi:MAG TPA: adenylosuccinate lyase [Polyangia bacterium]|nr:adenylosuccinate lyase [Polyangia bacterium]
MISRYARPEMQELWGDAHRYETWLAVELAACEAMEELGEVPRGTAAAVRAQVRLDPARIVEIEAGTQHDVIAFLTQVEESAGEPARWLHLGMTSSDVLDAALAILLREAVDLIDKQVDALLAALRRRAEEHRRTPMIGRTHGIHAEPTTLGLVFARWHAELARARRRLRWARSGIAVGKIAGAVGTYAHLAPAIEERALAKLGLRPETVPTQVVGRDRHAELACALALLGAAVEQIALTIRHWQRTEVGEAEEPFGKGQKGSSAMPHKKNPIQSENLTGLARLLRAYAGAALEDVALWHERDISHSSVERVIFPDATTLAHFMLVRLERLIEGLVLYPERMLQNLERSGGLVFSEGVLLLLVKKGLPRQRAYEIVQKNALAAHAGRGRFRDLLARDPEVAGLLAPTELDQAFDLNHHLRNVDAIFARAFAEEHD